MILRREVLSTDHSISYWLNELMAMANVSARGNDQTSSTLLIKRSIHPMFNSTPSTRLIKGTTRGISSTFILGVQPHNIPQSEQPHRRGDKHTSHEMAPSDYVYGVTLDGLSKNSQPHHSFPSQAENLTDCSILIKSSHSQY